MLKFVYILCLLFTASKAYAAVDTLVVDSLYIEEKIKLGQLDVKLMFPINSPVLDYNFNENNYEIQKLDEIFSDRTSLFGLDSLEIIATASIDGPYEANARLSQARAESVVEFLSGRYSSIHPELLKSRNIPEDWNGLREGIINSDVPNKTEVLEIVDSLTLSDSEKESRLRRLAGGSVWIYLSENVLPNQRYGASVVFYYDIEKRNTILRTIRDTVTIRDTITLIQVDTVAIEKPRCEKYTKFALKTNLLYAGLTGTPNLAFETALSDSLSLDFSFGYNPWNINGRPGDNKKLVHWMAQVEVRHFFSGRVFKGHFLGLHALATQYNISNHELPWLFEKGSVDYRYQGYGVGAGLSYGYQWCLSERWGLEATIGIGYIYQNYDKYTHPRCGYLVEADVVNHYFGITRAGLSLIYKFGQRENK